MDLAEAGLLEAEKSSVGEEETALGRPCIKPPAVSVGQAVRFLLDQQEADLCFALIVLANKVEEEMVADRQDLKENGMRGLVLRIKKLTTVRLLPDQL